jgi:hypothetical protein
MRKRKANFKGTIIRHTTNNGLVVWETMGAKQKWNDFQDYKDVFVWSKKQLRKY